MSIRPFSSLEKKILRNIIEKSGWQNKGIIDNNLRYSMKKDKTLLFTIKHPIVLPLHLNIPFEVAFFRVSLAFKFWNLSQKMSMIILDLMKKLKSLSSQISMKHDLPIKGKESSILNMMNSIIPDKIIDENERAWLNRIRVSLMNKRDQFKALNKEKVKAIVEILKLSGLEPTFKQPWELCKGLPKIRTSETLFFSNDELYDEFFILEKGGYFTYFKDLMYNKFYIRSSFDSYTPCILNDVLNDVSDFKIETLAKNWIMFARLILNSLIEIIDTGNINQNELVQFKPEKELNSNNFESDNNFPFSALHYESIISKQLFPIHNDLFNTPPTNFEVIKTLNHYTNAEELIKNYNFKEATNLLNESLIVFNKNRQSKIVVSILLLLRKIASNLSQHDIAINYLQNALNTAKSGYVPIEYIVNIHYGLGKTFFQIKDYNKALDHFNVIIKFLENEKVSLNKEEFSGMAYLYIGLINLEQNNVSESKRNFRKSLDLGNNCIKVKLKYYLLRARYFKDKGQNYLSQAQKLMKLGINSVGLVFNNNKYQNILIDLVLELTEFYLHYHIDSKKANYLLTRIKNEVTFDKKELTGMHKALKWNLLMSNYYSLFEKNNEKSKYYLKQSEILRAQLKNIGVLN